MKRVHSVETVEEAYLIISMFDAYGIPASLENDLVIAVDPILSNAIGGVKIFVDEERFVEAKGLLDLPEMVEDQKHCPHCDSTKIRSLRLSWWNLIFFFTPGFILPIGLKRMYCQGCLKKFREKEIVLKSSGPNPEFDKLVEEAMSHPRPDSNPEPLPEYWGFVSGFFWSALLFAVMAPLYYFKYDYFPSADIFFRFVLVGGGILFLLSYAKAKRAKAFKTNKMSQDEGN